MNIFYAQKFGVFTSKISFKSFVFTVSGKIKWFYKGRDRSFHFGSRSQYSWYDSHLGPQMGVADGIALANKIKNKKLLQYWRWWCKRRRFS